MSRLSQDLRYAVRAADRQPGLFAASPSCRSRSASAPTRRSSASSSALLLRPLPYRNADRQVILWNTSPGLGITEDWFSTAQYFDIKNGQRSFEDVAIAIGANANLTGDGEPERIGTIRVSSNLLSMLGARPLLGELFTAEDDVPGRTRQGAARLRHVDAPLWRRSARSLAGRCTLNGQPYEIAGVLPASFSLPREVMPTLGVVEEAEIVLPLPLAADAARGPQSRGLQHHRDARRRARRSSRRGPSSTRSPPVSGASTRTSILRTAA